MSNRQLLIIISFRSTRFLLCLRTFPSLPYTVKRWTIYPQWSSNEHQNNILSIYFFISLMEIFRNWRILKYIAGTLVPGNHIPIAFFVIWKSFAKINLDHPFVCDTPLDTPVRRVYVYSYTVCGYRNKQRVFVIILTWITIECKHSQFFA